MHHKVRQWEGLAVKKQPPSLKANPGLSKDRTGKGSRRDLRVAAAGLGGGCLILILMLAPCWWGDFSRWK